MPRSLVNEKRRNHARSARGAIGGGRVVRTESAGETESERMSRSHTAAVVAATTGDNDDDNDEEGGTPPLVDGIRAFPV